VRAAIAALPRRALGRFGAWATGIGTGALCRLWPAPAGTPAPFGAFPDVPMLVLAGDQDMRTPVANAVSVAGRFRRGRLLVVPGVGHGVLFGDASGCPERAVRRWLVGSPTPARCPRVRPLTAPLPAFARSLAGLRPRGGLPGRAGRTLNAVGRTLREATAIVLLAAFSGPRPVEAAGLHGGRVVVVPWRGLVRLDRYSVVPGVELSGRLDAFEFLPRLKLTGSVRVGGAEATPGRLLVLGEELTGALGGRPVGRRGG